MVFCFVFFYLVKNRYIQVYDVREIETVFCFHFRKSYLFCLQSRYYFAFCIYFCFFFWLFWFAKRPFWLHLCFLFAWYLIITSFFILPNKFPKGTNEAFRTGTGFLRPNSINTSDSKKDMETPSCLEENIW